MLAAGLARECNEDSDEHDDLDSSPSSLCPLSLAATSDVPSFRWLRSHPRAALIGEGAYGNVYAHMDIAKGEFVSVKRLLMRSLSRGGRCCSGVPMELIHELQALIYPQTTSPLPSLDSERSRGRGLCSGTPHLHTMMQSPTSARCPPAQMTGVPIIVTVTAPQPQEPEGGAGTCCEQHLPTLHDVLFHKGRGLLVTGLADVDLEALMGRLSAAYCNSHLMAASIAQAGTGRSHRGLQQDNSVASHQLPLPPVLTVHGIAQILYQILLGITNLHDRHIIHQDVKPGNVLLTAVRSSVRAAAGSGALVTLTDFGMSMVSAVEAEVTAEIESSAAAEVMRRRRQQASPCATEGGKPADNSLQGIATNESGAAPFPSFGFDEAVPDVPRWEGGMSPLVISTSYRPPELLFGSRTHGPEVDSWSFGVLCAEMMRLLIQSWSCASRATATATCKPNQESSDNGDTREDTCLTLIPCRGVLDAMSRVTTVLGDMSASVWPGVTQLPDFMRMHHTCPYCPDDDSSDAETGGSSSAVPLMPDQESDSYHGILQLLSRIPAGAEDRSNKLPPLSSLTCLPQTGTGTPATPCLHACAIEGIARWTGIWDAGRHPEWGAAFPDLLQLFDLTARCLIFDPSRRLTCTQALSHPIFEVAPTQPQDESTLAATSASDPLPLSRDVAGGVRHSSGRKRKFDQISDSHVLPPVEAKPDSALTAFDGEWARAIQWYHAASHTAAKRSLHHNSTNVHATGTGNSCPAMTRGDADSQVRGSDEDDPFGFFVESDDETGATTALSASQPPPSRRRRLLGASLSGLEYQWDGSSGGEVPQPHDSQLNHDHDASPAGLNTRVHALSTAARVGSGAHHTLGSLSAHSRAAASALSGHASSASAVHMSSQGSVRGAGASRPMHAGSFARTGMTARMAQMQPLADVASSPVAANLFAAFCEDSTTSTSCDQPVQQAQNNEAEVVPQSHSYITCTCASQLN